MSEYLEFKETYEFKIRKAKEEIANGNKKCAVSYLKDSLKYSEKLKNFNFISDSERDLYEENDANARAYIKSMENPTPIVKRQISGQTGNSDLKPPPDSFFDEAIPSVKLADIEGLKDLIDEFNAKVITRFNNPGDHAVYCKPKNSVSILLYGPPGTGKTYSVRCLAGELNCHIAVVNVQDILDKYVGEAPKKIKDIFSEANQYERCVIFFDELDAIASSRDSEDSKHTKDILTALLTEMDGFSKDPKSGKLKIIIAATNRPWALDSAILRGGRFGTKIYVGPPDKEAIKGIIKRSFMLNDDLKDPKYPPFDENSEILFEKLANDLSCGYSGGDIKEICERSAELTANKAIESQKRIKIPIKYTLCKEIISKTNKTITNDMLQEFEDYKLGKKNTQATNATITPGILQMIVGVMQQQVCIMEKLALKNKVKEENNKNSGDGD